MEVSPGAHTLFQLAMRRASTTARVALLPRAPLLAFGFTLIVLSFGLLVAGTRVGAPLPFNPTQNKGRSLVEPQVGIDVAPAAQPLILRPLPPATARQINAATPFARVANPAAEPFRLVGSSEAQARAVACLATAQWYEAGPDREGQEAVAQVVLNRVRHPSFPHSICGVVFQGSERETGCQFTFTCDGALNKRPTDVAWQHTIKLASEMLAGKVYRPVGLATHYHTNWVLPYWSGSLDKVAMVGSHLFFKWRGGWGQLPAFKMAYSGSEPPIPRIAFLDASHRNESGINEPSGIANIVSTETNSLPASVAFGLEFARNQDPSLQTVNMRGSELMLVHPDGGAYAVVLGPSSLSGNYALMALDLCKRRVFCKVMGWLNRSDVPGRFPIRPEAQATMAFLYISDHRTGQELVRWDCTRIERSHTSECLTPELRRWDALASLTLRPPSTIADATN